MKAIGKLAEISGYYYFKLFRGKIEGEENLYQMLGIDFILAANHQSMNDFLVLSALFNYKYKKKICFIAGIKLYRHPFWKHVVEYGNCICTDKSKKDVHLPEKVNKVLNSGLVLGIFPEGTRTPDGNLVKAKDGAVKLALLTKAPILPVGIEGFYENWPRYKALPSLWPRKSRIVFGKPISYETLNSYRDKNRDYEEMTRLLMTGIGNLIGKEYHF